MRVWVKIIIVYVRRWGKLIIGLPLLVGYCNFRFGSMEGVTALSIWRRVSDRCVNPQLDPHSKQSGSPTRRIAMTDADVERRVKEFFELKIVFERVFTRYDKVDMADLT